MEFEEAVELMNACPDDIQISTEQKLLLYSYYKQSTAGDCEGIRPSFYQVVEKAKYDAYYKLKGMDSNEAKSNYVNLAKSILENVKNEYPLIAQQLEQYYHKDTIEKQEKIPEIERRVSLELVKENKMLSIKLKWTKRLSMLLFLIVIIQFKVPFRKLIEMVLKK